MDNKLDISIKTKIREYAENMDVEIWTDKEADRLVIVAYNEAGFNCTNVDLIDTLLHVKEKMPDLWEIVK